MHFLILVAFLATAHARAVNISNTWVLPEEGFPVFYRYFRDRISWYEADAVCQFHHANLVTVDTTAQYDAVRAYLKELDISSAVWVGLIRSNPEGEFTWTDYRGLSGDGYWSSAPDPRIAPLCAAADPTADYRWAARACGGPTVAAFICELPVPQWALGKEGCMVRALPALTILYLPESAAVQLTADCGLAGVKRIQCTGNVKREELLRDLSCADEEELLTASNNISMNSTTTEITTVSENQESTTVIITEGNTNIEVETDNNNNSTPSMISEPSILKEDIGKLTTSELQTTSEPMLNTDKILTEKNIKSNDMQNNNLKSNDIPNLVNNDHFLTNYRIQKIEDEENMQHKKLHDELARLGNFETIFTQPTDHFVPPLVIAKSKLSDDMTVLSLEEKHAQYFGAHNALKHSNERNATEDINKKSLISTEQPNEIFIVTALTTEQTITLKDTLKNKSILPKKYIQSDFELKTSNVSKSKTKKLNKQNVIKEIVNQNNLFLEETPSKVTGMTSTTGNTNDFDEMHNDAVIDLTVTLREIGDKEVQNNISDFRKFDKNMTIEYVQTTENLNTSELVLQSSTYEPTNIYNRLLEFVTNNVTVTDNSTHFNDTSTVPDITTKMPLFKDELNNTLTTNAIYSNLHVETYNKSVDLTTETLHPEVSSVIITEIQYPISNSTISPTTSVIVQSYNKITQSTPLITSPSPTKTAPVITFSSNKSDVIDDESLSTVNPIVNDATNITENMEAIDNDSGDLESIDDFQSPLLSAANEPLQRPNRSRRPKQSLNRITKFNPFRILG